MYVLYIEQIVRALFLIVVVCGCGRYVLDAGHLRVAAGGGRPRGRPWRCRTRAGAARALHTDARPVRLLPPRHHRVRGQYNNFSL